jgi:hypothetical protein
MSQALNEIEVDLNEVVANIVTEDDEPVDNLYSEKQMRLLTEPLYSSWTPPAREQDKSNEPRPFLAAANVGLFPSIHEPPLVPDVFLSLDVRVHQNWYDKNHRTYFFWEFGKAPEVVIEIVSNRKGNETGSKLYDYARIGVSYYIVHDPARRLSKRVLQVYERRGRKFHARSDFHLPDVGLRLSLWEGVYEGHQDIWLRWCDAAGRLILTGAERAAQEAEARQRAEAEVKRLQAELKKLQQQMAKNKKTRKPGR